MTQPWEIEEFLDIRNGRLHVDGVSAADLEREHGTPLFVFSEQRIRHNIARLKKVADVIDRPLKLCYAAKAMSTMGVLRAVRDAGCDLEVNSGGELWKGLRAGFRGDQINFNGNSKEVWELELAIKNEIYAIQVDSVYELQLIEETAKHLGKRANVSLRLVPEIESHTHSGLQTALLTSKFGMMPDEAYAAFREYKDSPHLSLDGIHLHIGSQNPDPQVYSDAFFALIESLRHIFAETGIRLKHVNLGGGFPVDYIGRNPTGREGVLSSGSPALDTLAAAQVSASQYDLLSAHFEPADALRNAWSAAKDLAGGTDLLDDLTILLEPGRSIIADAGVCLTTVRNVKQRPNAPVRGIGTAPAEGAAKYENWLFTDAGFNILLSMETYKWYYHLVSATRPNAPHDTRYKVAGPLCDGGDVYFDIEGEGRLPDHRMLPENVQPGEILVLLNCGAYSLAQASQYNGRFLPPVILIDSAGVPGIIRRRDTFEDLIAADIDDL